MGKKVKEQEKEISSKSDGSEGDSQDRKRRDMKTWSEGSRE